MKKAIAFVLMFMLCMGTAVAESDANSAYKAVLQQLLDAYTWPDGSAAYDAAFQEYEDFSENEFALCDVDGDGDLELLVQINTGSMADMCIRVYGYKDGNLICELTEFPGTDWYEDGIVVAKSSHNQTESEFWPYDLWQYDAESNMYVSKGYVYACDAEMSNDFPTAADVDGDGRVYYILSDDVDYDSLVAVDGDAYESWRSTNMGDAAPVEPVWQLLTQENADTLK